MIVTIWRHGEAGSAISDRQRELTGKGIDDIGFACHQFHDICVDRGLEPPGLILHSEWMRTRQTADILASAFSHAEQRPERALIPGSDLPDVDHCLQALLDTPSTPGHLLLVSHQPLVSRLIDYYVGEPGRVPGLSPGGLACLKMEVAARACARLQFWALPPTYEASQ